MSHFVIQCSCEGPSHIIWRTKMRLYILFLFIWRHLRLDCCDAHTIIAKALFHYSPVGGDEHSVQLQVDRKHWCTTSLPQSFWFIYARGSRSSRPKGEVWMCQAGTWDRTQTQRTVQGKGFYFHPHTIHPSTEWDNNRLETPKGPRLWG